MSKNKDPSKPETYEELLQLFNGPNLDGKNKDYHNLGRYLDWYKTAFVSPQYEQFIRDKLSVLGTVDKIKENPDKYTYDLKLDSRKLLCEVTSINSTVKHTFVKPISTNEEFLSKLEVAIYHIIIKDSSEFPNYTKGGVIFYDIVTALRTYPSFHENVISMLPNAKHLVIMEWDYLVFIKQISSSPEGSSLELVPIIIVLKDQSLRAMFDRVFKDLNYQYLLIEEEAARARALLN